MRLHPRRATALSPHAQSCRRRIAVEDDLRGLVSWAATPSLMQVNLWAQLHASMDRSHSTARTLPTLLWGNLGRWVLHEADAGANWHQACCEQSGGPRR